HGQLVEKARRDRGRPSAVNAPVSGKIDLGAAAGASKADLRQAPLLFPSCPSLFVERALARKQTFLPAGQEDVVELQTLCRMERHQRHRIFLGAAVAVHYQRDVLEETVQVFEFLHRADELLQVLEPSS